MSTAAALVVAGLIALGCDRSGEGDHGRPASGPSDSAFGPQSPLDTVKAVGKWRREGRLGRIEAHIVDDQRSAVMELLRAVDRLVAADSALREAATQRLGRATAGAFDHAQVANLVGVFSRDVEVLDESIAGETAVVTIQVAGRVPLDAVHLVRREGRWQIRTDPPIEGLATELGRLADVLGSAARHVSDGEWSAEQLHRELDFQTCGIRRRIGQLTSAKAP